MVEKRHESSPGGRSFQSCLDSFARTLAVRRELFAQLVPLGVQPPHAQNLLRVLTNSPSAVAAALQGSWTPADVSEATMELWTSLLPFIDSTTVDPSIRIPARRWITGTLPPRRPG